MCIDTLNLLLPLALPRLLFLNKRGRLAEHIEVIWGELCEHSNYDLNKNLRTPFLIDSALSHGDSQQQPCSRLRVLQKKIDANIRHLQFIWENAKMQLKKEKEVYQARWKRKEKKDMNGGEKKEEKAR